MWDSLHQLVSGEEKEKWSQNYFPYDMTNNDEKYWGPNFFDPRHFG